MSKPKVLGHFDRNRVTKKFTTEGRTEQSHKDECDVNRIMDKYQQTGLIDHAAKHTARYGPMAGFDFQQAQIIMAQGNSAWEELPHSIKDQFADRDEFLDFVADKENRAEMYKMGLLAEGVEIPDDLPEETEEGAPEPETEETGDTEEK